MKKVILDTDIGSDIDDAFCLAYLLAHPACDLLGVTTVSGESQKRAELASALCRHAGKDIPIYAGVEQPLLIPQKQPHARQHAAISGWPHGSGFSSDAVGFLRQLILDNPHEITLLAIGPLTNVAVLFAADRRIPSLLKELVIMGGRFKNAMPGLLPAEWNILCDPHAAQIVLAAMTQRMRCIGLDVTLQVKIPKADLAERMRSHLLQPVADFAKEWRSDIVTFHDPLAAAVIFEQDLCGYERGKAEVELKSDRLAGLTHWDADPEGGHSAAVSVDAERFFAHYFDVVGKVVL